MAVKLYVGGLSHSTTSDTLRQQFARRGSVQSATIVTDRDSGQSRGFGFVEMSTAEGVQAAISQLDGPSLDGRAITVHITNSPGGRPGGGGRGGGGPRRSPPW
jgi:RNA recognition motif-containing protein